MGLTLIVCGREGIAYIGAAIAKGLRARSEEVSDFGGRPDGEPVGVAADLESLWKQPQDLSQPPLRKLTALSRAYRNGGLRYGGLGNGGWRYGMDG